MAKSKKALKNPYGGKVYTEKQLNHMMDEMISKSTDKKQIEALKKLKF